MTSSRNYFAKLMFDKCEMLTKHGNPPYLRLWLLAVMHAKANGHAEFREGELGELLGRKKQRDVDNAISRAVEFGLLHMASIPTCLVLTDLVTIAGRRLACKTHGAGAAPAVSATACRHTDRRNYAHGRCESCYRSEVRIARRENRAPVW